MAFELKIIIESDQNHEFKGFTDNSIHIGNYIS